MSKQFFFNHFRVDLEAMEMKGNNTFPKGQALLQPHHQIV